MCQHSYLLSLLITFLVWSCYALDGIVSDPQTHLLTIGCTPFDRFIISDLSVFNNNLNATFRDIREQVRDQNKLFAAVQESGGGSPVFTIFQCRNYLSITDCLTCFDVAAIKIRSCPAGAPGGHVVYDGCFLRYDASPFFDRATDTFNAALCGNTTTGEPTAFTSAVQKQLMNLQNKLPIITGFSAATKTQVPNNGSTIYAFVQCTETVTQSGCFNCLSVGYRNMQTCLPTSEGRAFDQGCFMRYSRTSFFPDNYQIIDVVTPMNDKHGSSNNGIIFGGAVGGLILLVLVALTLFVWIRPPKSTNRVPAGGDITGASKLKGAISYSYMDLKFATKNFSAENKLGEGGFGTVYKGTLKNGKVVAVKKLTLRHSKKVEEEFESEVKLISNVHHRNLVRLLGYCSKGSERILVYEYMRNTSLDKFLFGKIKGSLGWKRRYDIILGTARGLTYLHEEFHVRIIHRDIKSNNILLDDDLQPKIADFGLARLLPEDKSHFSTRFAGTLGYAAPEYAINGQLSKKVDIYSYGVVVLEIISGQKSQELNVNGEAEGAFLLQKAWKLYERGMHLELVDNTLDPNEYDAKEVKKVIEIGLLCTQASAALRPTMSEVVVLLQNEGLFENMKPTMPFLVETKKGKLNEMR